MHTATSQGGAEIEGRGSRSGMSSMKIGTYLKSWVVNNFSTRQIQPPGMSFQATELSYKIKVDSFIPFVLLGDDIKRYDTIGSWLLSYQEILRHLQLADLFTKHEHWKSIMSIIDSTKEDIYDVILGFYDMILKVGDTSDSQWEFYVKEHSSSATPFEEIKHWGDLLNSTRLLNQSKDITMKWEQQFNTWLHGRSNKLNVDIPLMVKAEYTYPGFRSRPPEYTIIQQNDYQRILLAKKWRDRKVGGIPGLSQSTWRIYKNKAKEAIETYITNKMKSISGIEISRLSEIKLAGYLSLLDDDWYLYDMKTAEKQTGLALGWTGFTCDLGHPKFPAEYASEMYSGIGPTSILNEIMMAIFLRVMREDEGWLGSRAMFFSDNLAVDKELPDQPFLEVATEFCGLNRDKQAFAPPSVCTDNPKHRLRFNGTFQKQVQSIQYIMRPMLACIMNGLGERFVTKRFLEWCQEREIFLEGEGDRKDYLVDEILRQPDIHKDIRQDFADVETFVKKYWYVDTSDPNFSTNLRVMD